MIFRNTNKLCPKCNRTQLEAIEIVEKNVAGYKCHKCGADYDSEVFHDWDNKKHYWLGKLRNPDFWKLDNNTIEEGILEFEKREKQGIKEYLGTYIIEEI